MLPGWYRNLSADVCTVSDCEAQQGERLGQATISTGSIVTGRGYLPYICAEPATCGAYLLGAAYMALRSYRTTYLPSCAICEAPVPSMSGMDYTPEKCSGSSCCCISGISFFPSMRYSDLFSLCGIIHPLSENPFSAFFLYLTCPHPYRIPIPLSLTGTCYHYPLCISPYLYLG